MLSNKKKLTPEGNQAKCFISDKLDFLIIFLRIKNKFVLESANFICT